jgi:type I restriction enzyme, R subunit
VLQAIARVKRPYDEIKKHGVIRDFWGVFSHLNEALRYDKAELGEAAFPLRRVREEFKLHMETILSNSIPRFIALVLSRLSFDNIGSEALR